MYSSDGELESMGAMAITIQMIEVVEYFYRLVFLEP